MDEKKAPERERDEYIDRMVIEFMKIITAHQLTYREARLVAQKLDSHVFEIQKRVMEELYFKFS